MKKSNRIVRFYRRFTSKQRNTILLLIFVLFVLWSITSTSKHRKSSIPQKSSSALSSILTSHNQKMPSFRSSIPDEMTTRIDVPECTSTSASPLCECNNVASGTYDPECVKTWSLRQQEMRHPGLVFYFAEDGPSVDFSSDRMNKMMFASIYSTLLQHCPGDVVIVMYSNSVPENTFRSLQERGYPVVIRRYDLEELLDSELSSEIVTFVRTFWSEHNSRKGSASSTTTKTTGKACWGEDKSFVAGKYDIVQFSDIFRYLVLYKYGGTFNDVDSILIQTMVRVSKRQNLIGRSVASPCRPAKFEDSTTNCLPSWIGIDYDTSSYDVGYDWYLSNGLFVGMSPESKYILRLLKLMKRSYRVNCECCLGRNLLTRAYEDLYFPSSVSLDTSAPIFRVPRPLVKTLPVTRMWMWRYQVDPKTRKTIGLINTPFDESNFRYWIRTQNSYTVHLDTQTACSKGSYCDVILNSVISTWRSVQNSRMSERLMLKSNCASSSFVVAEQNNNNPGTGGNVDEDKDWEKRTTMLITSLLPWRIRDPPSSIIRDSALFPNIKRWNLLTSHRELDQYDGEAVMLILSWLTLSGSKTAPMQMGGWLGRTSRSSTDSSRLIVKDAYELNVRGFDKINSEAVYSASRKASFEVELSSIFSVTDSTKNGGRMMHACWVGTII